MGVLIVFTQKQRQHAEVMKSLQVLAHRRDFSEASFVELVESYNGLKNKRYAQRYARRLLALYRAGYLTFRDVERGDFSKAWKKADSNWITPEGQILTREAQERRLMEKENQKQSKNVLQKCAAISKSGEPCRAKALPSEIYCRMHLQCAIVAHRDNFDGE